MNLRWSGPLLCAVAVLGLLPAAEPPRKLVAVFGSSPPMVDRDGQGNPRGFAVDVFNEAARRAGIALEWRYGGTVRNNNEALRRGDIDLIPTGVETPERQREFYISAPWWEHQVIALAPAGSPVKSEQDIHGRRLAVPQSAATEVGRHYPDSVIVGKSSAGEAAESACAGEADAALIPDVYLRELLFAASKACAGVGLRTFETAASLEYVVVARKEVVPLVKQLRGQIDEITMDGSLAAIAAQHPPASSPYATRMAAFLKERQEHRVWVTTMTAAALVLLLGTAALFWQLRANRRLRELNEKLRESDERWQFALQGAGAGIWDWDAKSGTTYYSRQCKTMLGFTEDEIGDLREEWDRRIHPDDRDRTRAMLDKHMAGQIPLFSSEYRLECKDGSYKWILARGRVISRDRDGKPSRCLGTFTDITSMKAAEAEGERLHELFMKAQGRPPA